MDPIKSISVREQVADALRKAIYRGEIRWGESLTQEAVASRLGVSRMPVREAFLMLARDGLLVLENHRRAVVRPLSPEEVADHYDIRSLLEGEAAARACKNGDLTDVLACHEEADRAAASGNADAFVEANYAFHHAVWEASGSGNLVQLLEQMWNGLPPHLPQLVPGQVEHSQLEHRWIVEALMAGDAETARTVMAAHIRRSMVEFLHSFRGFAPTARDAKEEVPQGPPRTPGPADGGLGPA
ncbi:GntR family transcriptional regulator [Alicyclobacillus sp.]|uniref:GntR family transcriptional regulator n=1 Tax=Alicyclobacillus sp. TaxID=61169 RepID=UPI0025C285E0|nr:GntR family transcriptional regulator [Alicyclobacillus sp.]MCL6516416.1 GntR family transcriptional regulator [Alicyclobacillus sp.]